MLCAGRRNIKAAIFVRSENKFRKTKQLFERKKLCQFDFWPPSEQTRAQLSDF